MKTFFMIHLFYDVFWKSGSVIKGAFVEFTVLMVVTRDHNNTCGNSGHKSAAMLIIISFTPGLFETGPHFRKHEQA
jgi:hypothetical protein